MQSLAERAMSLADDIETFPLGECSPSDDPDKQTEYVYSFKDISKRFISSVKRLNNPEINLFINEIDCDIEFITEAYDLKSDLQAVVDVVRDTESDTTKRLDHNITLTPKIENALREKIITFLKSESANNLPLICENYGLALGSVSEAFSNKKNYVYARISHLNAIELYALAEKIQGKYECPEFDEIMLSARAYENLNAITEFNKIKTLITEQIQSAKYLIWVAVAWFTDKDLANELYRKAKQGVNVQIIINDDGINKCLSGKLEQYFETHKIDPKNICLMHNKFCIIDLKKVIHGSYNWTNKAQYNDESVTLIESRNIAEEFASEFTKLKSRRLARVRT